MQEPPGSSRTSDVFWLHHVWLGVAMSFVVISVLGAYLATTPDGPDREVLSIALGVGFVLTCGAALLPWRRIVAAGSPERLLVAWSISLVPLIVLFTALDGGLRSPTTALLVLPLVFAAMAYPLRATVKVGAATVLGQIAIALATDDRQLGDVVIQVTILVVIASMAARIARNHERTLTRTEALADELRRLSRVDSLTSCLNHRGFHERLEAEAARALRDDQPLALLHLDLDHFKAINDAHGHPVGDEVLAAVGGTLRGLARRSDAVGRLGGEEFALLLPGTDLQEAEQVAERVRRAVRDQVAPVPVTTSIGVATLAGSGGRTDRLVSSADRALYTAKHAGRDRIATASGSRAPGPCS